MSQLLTRPVPETASHSRPTQRSRGWHSLPTLWRRVALFALLVVGWQAYVSLSGVDAKLISAPVDVSAALVRGAVDGSLLSATLTTLRILLTGMAIGMLVAALLTTLATWSKLGEDVLVLLSSMINPLPAIAVLPLAILWFGLSSTALVVVIANAVVWPIAINVSTGFRTVNPTITSVARNIGLRGWPMVRDVLMPAALPYILTGVKTGWAFGWRTIIAAELVFGAAGGKGGLGFYINDARYFLRTDEVFAGLVSIALIGIALDLLFTWIERKTVVKWGMKAS